jgi:hypothetical protein
MLKALTWQRLQELMASPGMQDVSHALILYTERHFKRMDRHLQSAFVLDYLLQGMHVYEADAGEDVTGSGDCWRVPEERYAAGIAALAQPRAKTSPLELENGLDGDDWGVEVALEDVGTANTASDRDNNQEQAKESTFDDDGGGESGHSKNFSGPRETETSGGPQEALLVGTRGRSSSAHRSSSSKQQRKSKQRAALDDDNQAYLDGAQDLGKEAGRENGALSMHAKRADGLHRATEEPASRKAGDSAAAVQEEKEDGEDEELVGLGVLAPGAAHVLLKRKKRSRSADGSKNGGGTKRRAGRRKST